MSRFTDALIVSPLADGKTWVLLSDFAYEVGSVGSGDIVETKKGFMTDFASIPRIFWSIFPKWGKYGNAAVVHDWLYWDQVRSRAKSDKIMFEAMSVLAVPAWQRHLIYWAVRSFGFIAWTRNKWERDEGYNRVISAKKIKAIKAGEVSGRPRMVTTTIKKVMKRK